MCEREREKSGFCFPSRVLPWKVKCVCDVSGRFSSHVSEEEMCENQDELLGGATSKRHLWDLSLLPPNVFVPIAWNGFVWKPSFKGRHAHAGVSKSDRHASIHHFFFFFFGWRTPSPQCQRPFFGRFGPIGARDSRRAGESGVLVSFPSYPLLRPSGQWRQRLASTFSRRRRRASRLGRCFPALQRTRFDSSNLYK